MFDYKVIDFSYWVKSITSWDVFILSGTLSKAKEIGYTACWLENWWTFLDIYIVVE